MSSVNNDTDILAQYGLQSDAKKKNDELGQEEFMTLMLAQLNNQDPMSPMENGDFLAQIAQFGTVSGIKELQGSFSTLADSLHSNQALQASSLVGRHVLVPSGTGALPEEGDLVGSISVPQSTMELGVNIYNANGQLVRHMELGSHAPGEAWFAWDGLSSEGQQMPAGTYTIEAQSKVNGKKEALETSIAAQVQSVTIDRKGGAPTLNLAGIGSVSFTKVQEIM